MKLIYSHLKTLLPDLDQPIEKIANELTLIGHMNEGINNIGGEQILNLEVRQNRGDCLGYYGLAKELAVLYDLDLQIPKVSLPKTENDKNPPVTISAEDKVKRIMSVKISSLKNKPSPDWLKKFLTIHEINSINTLVDLTNYIMLLYGIPCHAFDAEKIDSGLEWKITNKKDQIVTLDGTKVDIPKNSFIISDDQGAVSLPVLGGKRTAIDLNTNQTIIEMAIYDPVKVRLDAKQMNIQTDAKVRLEKGLDTNLIPIAFKHLIQLVLKECQGEITSQTLDFYPKKEKPNQIQLNLDKASEIAGINIPNEFSLKILKKLGGQIEENQKKYLVTPPSLRKDLNLEEDLIEEIIRFYGYDKIPTNQPISSEELADITPKVIYLKQTIKNILTNMGYDEIRSWPIINEKNLYQSKSLPSNAQVIETENSVNENYPLLRMSLVSSLSLQNKQYKKYKLPDKKFFEAGKIYYRRNNHYHELYSAAFYHPNKKKLVDDAQKVVKKLGGGEGDYYLEKYKNKTFIEINLSQLAKKLENISQIDLNNPKKQTQQAIELTKQIIDLDANIILNEKREPKEVIKEYQQKINTPHLWKLTIVDIYKTKKGKYKYTFRAFYYNLSAKEAKKIHLKVFDLK